MPKTSPTRPLKSDRGTRGTVEQDDPDPDHPGARLVTSRLDFLTGLCKSLVGWRVQPSNVRVLDVHVRPIGAEGEMRLHVRSERDEVPRPQQVHDIGVRVTVRTDVAAEGQLGGARYQIQPGRNVSRAERAVSTSVVGYLEDSH